ncbi:hypothetical protein [Hyphomicrobium sp. 2TAF46]
MRPQRRAFAQLQIAARALEGRFEFRLPVQPGRTCPSREVA